MPVTRSELMFLCGGAIAGVVIAKNWDKIKEQLGPLKEKVGPLLETASDAFGDAYASAAPGRRASRSHARRDGCGRPRAQPKEANGQTS